MIFTSTVPLSKSVHSLLRLEFLMHLAILVHDYFAVHVVGSGRAYCGVQAAPNSFFIQRNTCLIRYPTHSNCFVASEPVFYLFVHELRSAQSVVKVYFSSIRFYYSQVRSSFIGIFGSGCFSSVRCCF